MYRYSHAVFIGRFQPFHNGHLAVINKALELADKVVILVGSSNAPRSHRNPFSFEERKEMIRVALDKNVSPYFDDIIHVLPLEDTMYNDVKWVQNIQYKVENLTDEMSSVCLIGHSKDNSSYYLKMFPQWDSESVENVENINSTDIRNIFFSRVPLLPVDKIPEPVIDMLHVFRGSAEYTELVKEYEFVERYKESWNAAPYPPIFVTTDAVVVQSGHILLVKRSARPGKGLWALPGGFLNQSEKIEDGMLRELREETKIKVPLPVLRGSIVTNKVFDDPHRSSRGRTITHAFLINLHPWQELPEIKGSDDAEKAQWVPLVKVQRNVMMEDHYDIIQNMVAYL